MSVHFHFLVALFAGWMYRHQQLIIEYLQAENRVLREQLGGKRIRWTDAQRRVLAEKAKALGRGVLNELGCIVTPDTLLRWYRNLIAAKYDSSKKIRVGRPKKEQSIADLVVEMAQANPTWGYTRIRGALRNVGHEIGRNTVKRILADKGLEPAPERGKKTCWHTFIQSHLGFIAAADFFTVEVLKPLALVRYCVFFVIDIQSRRVHIAGITSQPSESWMKQIARNLTDSFDGFLKSTRYLILDRDPLFAPSFRAMLKAGGVNVVRLPLRSPDLNAFAERFVGSVRSECLNRIIALGEWHLRHVLTEYVKHYHLERNHQGLGNNLIEALPANTNAGEGAIRRRVRLGGLLSSYYRETG